MNLGDECLEFPHYTSLIECLRGFFQKKTKQERKVKVNAETGFELSMGKVNKVVSLMNKWFGAMNTRGEIYSSQLYIHTHETLVFCNGSKRSISNLFGFLHKYDASSGQRINKSKGALSLSRKTTAARKIVMQNTSGISAKGFQITYLGAPLYSGKLKRNYFEPLVSKEREVVAVQAQSFPDYDEKA